jgi:hypothetical protein
VSKSRGNLTQHELILDYINQYGFITSYTAYEKLGVTQLATRIRELKGMGYTFSTVTKKAKNRHGNPTHYYEYYLTKEVC